MGRPKTACVPRTSGLLVWRPMTRRAGARWRRSERRFRHLSPESTALFFFFVPRRTAMFETRAFRSPPSPFFFFFFCRHARHPAGPRPSAGPGDAHRLCGRLDEERGRRHQLTAFTKATGIRRWCRATRRPRRWPSRWRPARRPTCSPSADLELDGLRRAEEADQGGHPHEPPRAIGWC